MTDLCHKTPWVRVRGVRPLLDMQVKLLITQCELAVEFAPPEIFADRKALAVLLAEELRSTSDIIAEAVEVHWQAAWDKSMTGRFVDLPNIEN